MKKSVVAFLLFVSIAATAQAPQRVNAWHQYQRLGADKLLWVPNDTLKVPAFYSNHPYIAYKNDVLYTWNYAAKKWMPVKVSTPPAALPLVFNDPIYNPQTGQTWTVDTVAGKLQVVLQLTKDAVWLDNVDNVSDMNKPVSWAMQDELNLKAPLSSPTLSTPTASGWLDLPDRSTVPAAPANGTRLYSMGGHLYVIRSNGFIGLLY